MLSDLVLFETFASVSPQEAISSPGVSLNKVLEWCREVLGSVTGNVRASVEPRCGLVVTGSRGNAIESELAVALSVSMSGLPISCRQLRIRGGGLAEVGVEAREVDGTVELRVEIGVRSAFNVYMYIQGLEAPFLLKTPDDPFTMVAKIVGAIERARRVLEMVVEEVERCGTQ